MLRHSFEPVEGSNILWHILAPPPSQIFLFFFNFLPDLVACLFGWMFDSTRRMVESRQEGLIFYKRKKENSILLKQVNNSPFLFVGGVNQSSSSDEDYRRKRKWKQEHVNNQTRTCQQPNKNIDEKIETRTCKQPNKNMDEGKRKKGKN